MPTRTNSTTVKPSTDAAGKRFELPALDFKFGSLTEGTDIPPPPPSPKLEATLPTPQTPKEIGDKTNGAAAAANTTPEPNKTITSPGGTQRLATTTNDNSPSSPTLSTRQGSIRRLFSKNMLNDAYQEGENTPTSSPINRPESRLSTATVTGPPKKAKRSSSWFSRLRSSDSASSSANKRASIAVVPSLPPPIPEKRRGPSGPPPPMIPELETKFGSQEDGLSADLFKDIK